MQLGAAHCCHADGVDSGVDSGVYMCRTVWDSQMGCFDPNMYPKQLT